MSDVVDVAVIGSGVMGAFTAIQASRRGAKVAVIDKSYIGDPQASSFSTTRSVRNDYLDIEYSAFAEESRRIWAEFQQEAEEELIIYCGNLNLVLRKATPSFEESFAYGSNAILKRRGLPVEEFDRSELGQRFPQFDADAARFDVQAGFAFMPAVTNLFKRLLRSPNIELKENTEVRSISKDADGTLKIETDRSLVQARSLVVAASHGTNDVLSTIEGVDTRYPITKRRPVENKYYVPSEDKRDQFTPDVFPVFACLDIGIYGHPWYPGKTRGVKIAQYAPQDSKSFDEGASHVEDFVREHIPALADAEVTDILDSDLCSYDHTPDDEFILGNLPGHDNVFVGVGWRGTGYKFGPWVGRVLSQLALEGRTLYDISRFDPNRPTLKDFQ